MEKKTLKLEDSKIGYIKQDNGEHDQIQFVLESTIVKSEELIESFHDDGY